MPHPLLTTVGEMRRRGRSLALRYLVARFLAAVAATALVLGLFDFAVRYEDRVLRALATLVLVAVTAIAGRRAFRRWRASRLSDVETALEIERAHPPLRGQLGSAVEFLASPEDDPHAGSPVLRRHVIAEAASALATVDLERVFNRQPARQALGVALGIGTVVAVIALLNPVATRTAAERLVNPLADVRWPQRHHLKFVDPPQRLAVGATFEVELTDRDGEPLPDEVRIQYRYPDSAEEQADEEEPMQAIGGLMVARRHNVTRGFEYRAQGGDDRSMPWQRLDVIEPPELESVSVTLDYPDYTAWPTQEVEPRFSTIRGTLARFKGRATLPIASAALVLEGGQRIEAQVAADGRTFDVPVPDPLKLDASATYWFELTDAAGFHGGDRARYQARIQDDAPPVARFENQPSTLLVTPDARVPLEVVAKDDLAIARVELRYLRSDNSDAGQQTVVIHAGPEAATWNSDQPFAFEQLTGDQRAVSYVWELEPLALKPDTQLTFQATALDYVPQEGHSPPLRLTVVTRDELLDQLAEKQGAIRSELEQVLKTQRDARTQLGDLQIQAADVGSLAGSDLDELQGVGMSQEQIARQLVEGADSVAARARQVLADLRNNRVERVEVERQMGDLLAELGRLGDDVLPDVAEALTAAKKSALAQQDDPSTASASRDQMRQALDAAAAGQEETSEAVGNLVEALTQSDNDRRFRRDIRQLRQEQERLAAETAEKGRETLTERLSDLTPQQRADLAKLAQRQSELAAQLQTAVAEMQDAAGKLEADDPLAAELLRDAVNHAGGKVISGQMQEAGRAIGENQVGQATRGQARVAEQLEELEDILANRPAEGLARRLQQLRAAEQELSQLAEKHEGLRKKLEEASKSLQGKPGEPANEAAKQELERLTRQMRELEQEAQRMARKLARLQADRASRSTSSSGKRMSQAGEQSAAGDAQSASGSAAEAQRDLEDAMQQVAEARQAAEIDLARQQLATLLDALEGLRGRQEHVLTETKSYEDRKTASGRLTRAEAASVRELAREEELLEEETLAAAGTLEDAEVFRYVLEAAARDMQLVHQLLGERETGAVTQRSAEAALKRLTQMIEVARENSGAQQGDQAQQGKGEGQGENKNQGNARQLRALAELRLLRLLQQDVNDRTRQLDESRTADRGSADAIEREYALLSDEQGRLADMLLGMIEAKDATADEEQEFSDLLEGKAGEDPEAGAQEESSQPDELQQESSP